MCVVGRCFAVVSPRLFRFSLNQCAFTELLHLYLLFSTQLFKPFPPYLSYVFVVLVDCVEFDLQDGYTALIFAAEYGHADCVRLLLDVGADTGANNNVRRRSLPCSGALIFCILCLTHAFICVFTASA